jgi:hypothetical protein
LTGPLLTYAAEELIKRLLEDVGVDVERWKALLELLPVIPMPSAREAMVDALLSLSVSIVEESERSRLRAAVQRVVSHHRRFATATWVMPSPELDRLDQVVAALEPTDSVARATWVFSQRTDIDIGASTEEETSESTKRQAPVAALAEVLAEHGTNGLFRLAATVRLPRILGVVVGTLPADETRDRQILMRGLSVDATSSDRDFALGMVRQHLLVRGAENIRSLVARAVAESWGTNAAADILTELPPCRETWDLVASMGSDIEIAYWKRLFIYAVKEESEDVAFAIEKLMAVGRMTEAVELAGNRVQDPNRELKRVRAAAETDDTSAPKATPSVNPHRTLPTDLLVRVLTQVASAPVVPSAGRNDMTMFQYYVTEILKFLEEAGEIGRETLASLEWMYLPLLEYSNRLPHTLHDELARNPDFFATVLSALYRPDGDSGVKDTEPPDSESTDARAQRAFQLLQTWEQLPGRREDGSIDSEALSVWVQAARHACAKTGRTAVGDQHIGEILARSPADGNGVWPTQAVRKIIESTRSRDLERGFANGTYNRRGVTGRTVTEGGRQERSLAQTYRHWSRAIAARSPRTAAVLERLAREYEGEARENDENVDRESWT